MPRIMPLGDIESGLFPLPGADESPEPITKTRRIMLLSSLIRAWKKDIGADHAVRLATDLASLLDELSGHKLKYESLQGVVPDEFAAHWRLTLDFLKILSEHWPRILADEAKTDPVDYRNRKLEALAERLRAEGSPHPVIAAGTTASIPATMELIEAVSTLPNGYIILSGLDRVMSEEAFSELAETHPQHALKRLISRLKREKNEIPSWHGSHPITPREEFISHAMLPPEHTSLWRDAGLNPSGLSQIECRSSDEEASVISLLLRETLESPGKTAMLVTNDRKLSRMVAAKMRYWGINVNDSAGKSLSLTLSAVFLRLTAEMAASDAAPVPLLAMLKHPLAKAGAERKQAREFVWKIEKAALRGLRPEGGFGGILARLGACEESAWLAGVEETCRDFMSLISSPEASLSRLIKTHASMAENLAGKELWLAEGGEELAEFLNSIAGESDCHAPIEPWQYPALLDNLLSAETYRPKYGEHPRLDILSPMEARLLSYDRVILAGLNESSWPEVVPADSFLNQNIRRDIGLERLEAGIGQSAHDFARLSHAKEVFYTRSAKVERSPSVPSRFLMRISAVLSASRLPALSALNPYPEWAQALHEPEKRIEINRPEPKPDPASRPKRISATKIGMLCRDPYAFYAEKILRLRELEELDAEPRALDFGNFMHGAIEEFLAKYDTFPESEKLSSLLKIGEKRLSFLPRQSGTRRFWWPKFTRAAGWLVKEESARRKKNSKIFFEIKGAISLPTGHILEARADRIEVLNGFATIADYKTGAPPTKKDVEEFLEPQLPLEAIIALKSGFPGIQVTGISTLEYWCLGGGPKQERVSEIKSAPEIINSSREKLLAMLRLYNLPETPYPPRPGSKYQSYHHLSREKEWAG